MSFKIKKKDKDYESTVVFVIFTVLSMLQTSYKDYFSATNVVFGNLQQMLHFSK